MLTVAPVLMVEQAIKAERMGERPPKAVKAPEFPQLSKRAEAPEPTETSKEAESAQEASSASFSVQSEIHLAEKEQVEAAAVILPERPESAPSKALCPTAAEKARNFRITDDNLGTGGPKAKFRINMDAIKLLKELEAQGRQASPEEQETLSRYVGWGGLADAFDSTKSAWASEFQELSDILTPEEYAAARDSTLSAHYTSPTIIRAIYEAVGNMGFQSGNILEPAMGIGNFFGCLPASMSESKLYGVELDSITGRIAKQLYPKANITVAGFETTDRRDFFDLAIGNVPFGQYQVNDRAYNKLGFSIHDYFFAKAIDQVRPGGLIAFITSRYTMDNQSPEVRRYIAERAKLLGAVRLPNNAFKANAGAEVVSDILFLQKRDRPMDTEPEWVRLGENADGFSINRYFIDHPEMILGVSTSESTQYGRRDFTVAPMEGTELAVLLHQAIQNIHGMYQAVELPELGEDETIVTSIPADPDVKNYSYTVADGNVYYRENSIMVRPELNATALERIKGMVELRDCVHTLIDLQLDEDRANSAIKEQQVRLTPVLSGHTGRKDTSMSEERRMYRMTEGQRRHYLVLLFAGRVRQAIDFRDECDAQWTEHPDQWEKVKPGCGRPVTL